MIRTVLRIHWTNLRRDRVAQMLTFIVPMAFFTVFALIFGGRSGNGRVGFEAASEEAGGAKSTRRGGWEHAPALRAKVVGLSHDVAPQAKVTRRATEQCTPKIRKANVAEGYSELSRSRISSSMSAGSETVWAL